MNLPKACFLLSLTRMGSSVTSYGIAHAVRGSVLDEPFGPWDRTKPPYNYPAVQNTLRSAFHRAGGTLNAEVADRLRELVDQVAHPVVIKIPHLHLDASAVASFFPDWPAVVLLRNPLRRLNSLYTRRWNHLTTPSFDLETTREFLRRWIATEPDRRALFDDLQRDPSAFFRGILDAAGFDDGPAAVARAVAYRASHYHESSAELHDARSPSGVLSDHRRHVPREAVDVYLHDPLIRAVFARLGWSTDPATYADPEHPVLPSRLHRPPVPEPGHA